MCSSQSSKLHNNDSDNNSNPNIKNEYIQLTLQHQPLAAPAPLPSHSHMNRPLSFNVPFDDPEMEPLPFRGSDSASNHVIVPSESLFIRDDILVSPSRLDLGRPMIASDRRQNSIFPTDPSIGLSGSKRDFKLGLTNNDDLFDTTKRQRTKAGTEESMVRFKPSQEKLWREQFQRLLQFKLQHGHCRVPYDFPNDPILSRWVKRQRYQYKKFHDKSPSTMTTSRIEALESVGFIWNTHTTAWQEKFEELKVFKQRTGHCNVPSDFPENDALSTWVKCQRRHSKRYMSGKPCNITKERFEALAALGFVFNPRSEKAKDL